MSILIKGMKIPISCERCPMLDWDLDYIKCKVTDRRFKMTECWRAIRVPDCPLIEIPPHGRLIDADALQKDGWVLQKQVMRMGGYAIHEMPLSCPSIPTVIEAEDGDLS